MSPWTREWTIERVKGQVMERKGALRNSCRSRCNMDSSWETNGLPHHGLKKKKMLQE